MLGPVGVLGSLADTGPLLLTRRIDCNPGAGAIFGEGLECKGWLSMSLGVDVDQATAHFTLVGISLASLSQVGSR